jgi:hypothetical protein
MSTDSEMFGLMDCDVVSTLKILADTNCPETIQLQAIKNACNQLKDDLYLCEELFLTVDESLMENDDDSASFEGCRHRKTAFQIALRLLERSSSFTLAEAIIELLVIVVSNIGIGVENSLELISLLMKSVCWPPYSVVLLDGLSAMVSNDLGSAAQTARGDIPDDGQASEAGRPPQSRAFFPFFRFDGSPTSGLYLGGDANPFFDKGYAFETWIYVPRSGGPKPAYHLLRVLSGEGECHRGKAERIVLLDVVLAKGQLVVYAHHHTRHFRCACPTPVPEGEWVHVVLSHARSMIRTEVELWVQGRRFAHALPFPTRPPFLRLYAGCGGWPGLDERAQSNPVPLPCPL